MCMCLYMICYVYAANQRWSVELYRGRMKLSSITMHRGGRQLMFADVQFHTLTWLAVQALLKVCLYQKRNIVKAWLKALVKCFLSGKLFVMSLWLSQTFWNAWLKICLLYLYFICSFCNFLLSILYFINHKKI